MSSRDGWNWENTKRRKKAVIASLTMHEWNTTNWIEDTQISKSKSKPIVYSPLSCDLEGRDAPDVTSLINAVTKLQRNVSQQKL